MFPSTAPVIFTGLLRLKRCQPKRKYHGKEKATDSKVYAYSDIDLGEVLFHYVMFFEKESRDLSRKIYRVSFIGIS